MRVAERKLAELERKLAGITAEFDWWRADAGENRPLRKHQSQIIRLTDQLGGLAARVRDEIGQARADDGDILAAGRDLQLRMLEVHRLWDFFRSKLNLRYVAWFGPYLAVADEFAWACYQPALEHDGRDGVPAAAVKAAPLVFLSGEFSPFTHPRQTPFAVEDVEGALDSTDFLQVLYALPVPVIGLPWYQVAHLPDVVAIAHEAGHDVARDFGLAAVTEVHLREATMTLPGPVRNRWFGWLPEVFADLYGILCAGPAFASALADLLVADPALVAAESADPGPARHPPASLRIELAARALEQTGFAREAGAQRDAWAEAYGAAGPAGPFLDSAEAVVRKLLEGQYPQFGNKRLPEVVAFTGPQQDDAAAAAEAALAGQEPASDDIRCLVAAARLAFDRDPDGYHDAAVAGAMTAQELILGHAVAGLDDRPRASEDQPAPAPEQDRTAGADLLDLINSLARQRREG